MLSQNPRCKRLFWARVNKEGTIQPDGSRCWEWTGTVTPCGYGNFTWYGVATGTHRIAYELTYGQIRPGMMIRHYVCDNPICCNPAHLLEGTAKDNSDDMIRDGRQRPCIGESHGMSKLTEDDVRAILFLAEGGNYTPTKISKMFGISLTNTVHIINRKRWKHIK